MSETYKVLVDENQFLTFLERLGDIFPYETYLVNTAFRSKKLTDEERKQLGARNREVYLTKTIRGSDGCRVNSENALQKMYELEVPIKCLTFNKGTENEIALPQKAMTTFICCNPSNEIKVALKHIAAVNDIQKNIVLSNDGGADAKNQLAHTNSDFRSERMECNRTKWIDFDVDIENLESFDRTTVKDVYIKPFFKESKIFANLNGMVVSTKGGFHVLVDKNCIKGNPNEFAKSLATWLTNKGYEVKEVEFKSGPCMIPCPGILQYGSFIVNWEEL